MLRIGQRVEINYVGCLEDGTEFVNTWLMPDNVAVTLGSSLLGMVGLLVGVPITCVVYTLVREQMHKQLENRKIAADKLEPRK